MDIEEFDFHLPKHLIAKWPATERSSAKLIVLDRLNKNYTQDIFANITRYISDDYFLVLNNTKVNKARLYTRKDTGGKVEILLLNKINNYEYYCLTKGKISDKQRVYIDKYQCDIIKIYGKKERKIIFYDITGSKIMELYGEVPIPPYLKREANDIDKKYYQTVYSKVLGSVAAPTAGLHFDESTLYSLKLKGVEILEITLDVSYGTFKPIDKKDINEHEMHSENYYIKKDVMDRINYLKKEGKKLVAVGTTVVRALEDASNDEGLVEKWGNDETDLFIKPGYKFKIVDAMITNFHLPKSSLFILVSAFTGTNLLKETYNYAIENNFRFYSYGDGMLIK
ncbi:MAG: tRNA preQ1(34) S-adenosylmethionine ribosyltransferase-isomerase QueA [Deferribacterota bacterium]|nr:tRNA preQ1(34) S-adenosylmethionine ribosyltransferase-isomerase QueA [Deferribacterota bacterium]